MGDNAAIDGLQLRGEQAEFRQSHGQSQVKVVEPIVATGCYLRPCLHPWLRQGGLCKTRRRALRAGLRPAGTSPLDHVFKGFA